MLLLLICFRTEGGCHIISKLDLAFDNQRCEVLRGGDVGMIFFEVINEKIDQFEFGGGGFDDETVLLWALAHIREDVLELENVPPAVLEPELSQVMAVFFNEVIETRKFFK